jgi:hypothetical protein
MISRSAASGVRGHDALDGKQGHETRCLFCLVLFVPTWPYPILSSKPCTFPVPSFRVSGLHFTRLQIHFDWFTPNMVFFEAVVSPQIKLRLPIFFFRTLGCPIFKRTQTSYCWIYIYICIQVYNMNLSISHRIRLNIPIRIASKYPISSDSLTFRHRKSQRMTIWRTLWRQLGAMFFGIHSWKRQEDTELCWLAMVGL